MEIHKTLLPFLQSQKVLVLSTVDEKGFPWVSNVYFSVNTNLEFFFFSGKATKHSIHIEKNPTVAFSVVWHNKDDDSDRKAIQANGLCERITDPILLLKLVTQHYKYYPSWKKKGESITDVVNRVMETGAYVIKPNYIKYWNDEEFKEQEKVTQEYSFYN